MHRRPGFVEFGLKTIITILFLVVVLALSGVIGFFVFDQVDQEDSTVGAVTGNLKSFRDAANLGCEVEGARDERSIEFTFHPAVDEVYIWPPGEDTGTRIVASLAEPGKNASVPLKTCNLAAICEQDADGEHCNKGGRITVAGGSLQRQFKLHYTATDKESDFLVIDEIRW